MLVTAGFFLIGGLLHFGTFLYEATAPLSLEATWQAVGSSLLSLLMAAGLWRRLALCRSVAMVYCLAVIVTDLIALALALGRAPLQYPLSLVIQSAFEVPSCLLLLPFLRSPGAGVLFNRRLSARF